MTGYSVIIKGEGLCEYIRRIQKENSLETAQEKQSLINLRKQTGMTIMGNEEFINKFMESLPDDCK